MTNPPEIWCTVATMVLWKFQKDFNIDIDDMGKQNFVRFEFKILEILSFQIKLFYSGGL